MKMRYLLATVGLTCGIFAAANADTVDFDFAPDSSPITAPGLFSDVVPGPAEGPSLTTYDPIGVHFDGGVILSKDFFNHDSNVLATSDFLPLKDSSLLPGAIKITFAAPVTDVCMDVINGFGPARFTAMADTGENDTVSLDGFLTPGDHGSLELHGPAINSVLVFSSQNEQAKDFAIDNVCYEAVPEPASIASLCAGGLALVARRRRSA